jgi:hypothetical protein
MPHKIKNDPRAQFAGRSDAELREDLETLLVLVRDRQYQLAHREPTREAAEQKIAVFQQALKTRLANLASPAMLALGSAEPGSVGVQPADRAAIHCALASDDFAAALREHYAARRPTDADLEPLRTEIDHANRRRDAIKAELRLRELDMQREEDERIREAAVAELEAAH